MTTVPSMTRCSSSSEGAMRMSRCSSQHIGRDSWTQLRYISFQVGTDEMLTPTQTGLICFRQETIRKSAAKPECIGSVFGLLRYFFNRKPGKFFVRYPASQAFCCWGQLHLNC